MERRIGSVHCGAPTRRALRMWWMVARPFFRRLSYNAEKYAPVYTLQRELFSYDYHVIVLHIMLFIMLRRAFSTFSALDDLARLGKNPSGALRPPLPSRLR